MKVAKTILFWSTISIGCKFGSTPQESPASSPSSAVAAKPSFSPDYSSQNRFDNNQTPIGGGKPTIVINNPTFDSTETGKPLTFEELNPNSGAQPTITIQPIQSQQVFQRNAQNQAQISFSTSAPSRSARYLRARGVNDGNHQPVTQFLALDMQNNANSPLILTFVGGAWYRIEVIYYDQAGRIQEIGYSNPFGVGEVFVVAGQSNSTNCGSTPIRASSDYVVSTDGDRWQTAHDPQIGTNDFNLCQNGSSWPTAGDELVRQLQVPIAFASTGYSGTSVAEWLPNSGRGLYEFSVQRMRQLGPRNFRAVLWHQGENDVRDQTTQQVYSDRLLQIIRQSQQDTGWQVPWLVAQATWCRQIPEYNKPQAEPAIIAAQTSLPRNYPFVFAGPNTDLLTEQYRSTNCHFNQLGEVESGKAWARSITEFIQRSGQQLR